MPFGLINTPATFVRMTRFSLHGFKHIVMHMEDILIHTSSLTIKLSRVKISLNEMIFLQDIIQQGYVLKDYKIVK